MTIEQNTGEKKERQRLEGLWWAVALIWAGLVEGFFSQLHEPVLPYAVKISFGIIQLTGLFAYLLFAGRRSKTS